MDTSTLRAVISTLNGIEVKGKTNLDRLLGSIQVLEAYVAQVEHMHTNSQEDSDGRQESQ